jgi:hypothetical protein
LPKDAEATANAIPLRPLQQSILSVLERLIRDPLAAVCFVASSFVVFFGLRQGWLPGHQFVAESGSELASIPAWLVVCAFVSVTFTRPLDNDAARSVRGLSVCSLLTLLLALTPNLVAPLAYIYASARYLSLLMLIGCFGVLIRRVLPNETRSVWLHVRQRPVFWAAFAPLLAVFFVEFLSLPIAEKRWLLLLFSPRLSPGALLVNATILVHLRQLAC